MSENMLRELTARLARLEAEVKQIKDLLRREKDDAGKPWWETIAGSHKDDKVFAEIARLGAEIRRKNRHTARRDKRRKVTPKKRKASGRVGPAARSNSRWITSWTRTI